MTEIPVRIQVGDTRSVVVGTVFADSDEELMREIPDFLREVAAYWGLIVEAVDG